MLIDENLEAVSVRLHDEIPPKDETKGVRVKDASAARTKVPSDFFNEISSRIDSIDKKTGAFKKFTELVEFEMDQRSGWLTTEQRRKAA